MKIFLVRHGETDYGKKHFTTGHIDIPLNMTGKKEAQATTEFLKGRNIVKIFSSSLSRASETANIIASEFDLPVIESDELMEHTSGKLDGVSIKVFLDKLKSVGDFNKMILQSGGERWNVFTERVWNKFLEIVTKNKDEGNILIVTHGGVTRTIFSEIFGSPFLKVLSQGNCCINVINYDKEKEDMFRVELVNYTYHIN
ncbi:MAG: histidine phosphatase family protein [Candidatus Heimdallarchaeota archaeon]|nr:histidine phosphatase family protein [Candidatus Heimdallarchaeota archaeon]